MASDDIAQLADALSNTHVGDGELSFKGLGLKLDHAESGQMLSRAADLGIRFGPCFLLRPDTTCSLCFQWRIWSARSSSTRV